MWVGNIQSFESLTGTEKKNFLSFWLLGLGPSPILRLRLKHLVPLILKPLDSGTCIISSASSQAFRTGQALHHLFILALHIHMEFVTSIFI